MILSVRATEQRKAHLVNLCNQSAGTSFAFTWGSAPNCGLKKVSSNSFLDQVPWKRTAERVRLPFLSGDCNSTADTFNKSCWLGFQHKACGKCHKKLHIGGRSIAHKYGEGKMQRTLKRELKSTRKCWKGREGNPCLLCHHTTHLHASWSTEM